jgi:hypothetical protein
MNIKTLFKKAVALGLHGAESGDFCKSRRTPPPPTLLHDKYHSIVHFLSFFIFLLFTVGNLSALSGEFAGLGVECNANTREGAAIGGNLSLGVNLDHQFSLGIKTTFSSNIDTVTTLEPAVFFRYYLPFSFSGIFAQAELGASFFSEDNNSYPAFLGGLTFGWSYKVRNEWYIEPSIRFGYPFAWGVGILAGLSFDIAALR